MHRNGLMLVLPQTLPRCILTSIRIAGLVGTYSIATAAQGQAL